MYASLFLQLILTGTPDTHTPLEALLDVAAFPDAEVRSHSHTFWHKLARQMRPHNKQQQQQSWNPFGMGGGGRNQFTGR